VEENHNNTDTYSNRICVFGARWGA